MFDALLRWFYLLHLAFPVLLLADRAVLWSRGFRTSAHVAVLALAALWLAAGAAFYWHSRRRPERLARLSNALLTFWTVVLVVAICEAAAQIYVSPRIVLRKEYLYPPGASYTYRIDPSIAPGLEGAGRFTINELGLRGPGIETSLGDRVIAVGGSTTQCLYLDDSEAWPGVLMQELKARGRSAWVAAAAVAGHTTVHHLRFLQTLPSLREIDLLIFLAGINDLVTTMNHEGGATEDALQEATDRFFEGRWLRGHTLRSSGLLDRLMLYQLARIAFEPPDPTLHIDAAGRFYMGRRDERGRSPMVPMPRLDTGLAEYRRRIAAIGEECRKRKSRCLFLTQPTIWRDDLPQELQRMVWFGGVGEGSGRKGFTTIADLERAMARYNAALLEVCRQQGLECFDLAPAIPKDVSAFFDDCHFNENGARLVGKVLADYLSARPPFQLR